MTSLQGAVYEPPHRRSVEARLFSAFDAPACGSHSSTSREASATLTNGPRMSVKMLGRFSVMFNRMLIRIEDFEAVCALSG